MSLFDKLLGRVDPKLEAERKRREQEMERAIAPLRQKANQRLLTQRSAGTIPTGQVQGFGVLKPQEAQRRAYGLRMQDITGVQNTPQSKIHSFDSKRGANPISDFFDSDSGLDKFKRASQGQPTLYRDQQKAIGNKRPYESFGAQAVGNTGRFLNTTAAGISQIPSTVRGQVASMTNNQEALRNALTAQKNMRDFVGQADSGLFGVGTIYDNPEEMTNLGNAEIAKRVGLTTLGAMSEAVPFARVARPVSAGAKGAVQLYKGAPVVTNATRTGRLIQGANKAERGVYGLKARAGFNAGMDSTTGAGESVARQYAQTGQIDPMTLLGDTAASTLLGQAQLIPAYGKASYNNSKLVKNATDKTVDAGKKVNNEINLGKVTENKNKQIARRDTITAQKNEANRNGNKREYARLTKVEADLNDSIKKLEKREKFLGTNLGLSMKLTNDAELNARNNTGNVQSPDLNSKTVSSNSSLSPKNARAVKPIKSPTGLKIENRHVQDYASTLKSMDEGAKGGQMIADGEGGYYRISEHTSFYSDFYKQNKRPPSNKDWLDEAKRQIETGEADSNFYDYVASDIEANGNNLPNKPSTRMSVAEKESLFNEIPAGTDKKIKVSMPNDKKSVQVNRLIANEALPEMGTKQTSNLDKAFRSTRSVIERQGENGKMLANELQLARDTQEIYLSKLQQKMPTVTELARKGKNALVNKDFENFVDATQGLAEPKNAKVAQAVQEWQATHPEIRQRAVDAGLDVGDLGANYYPHFIDYDEVFKNKNTYNQSLNHLVKTGQAKNVEEAIKLLGYARDVSRNRQFGNLEASRLIDLPFYDKTPNSLISYLNGSAKRIAQVETFGAGDAKALKMIADAGQEGYDTEAMKNAYDVAVGAKQYNPNASKVSGGIRKYVTTTRLGLGAITNVAQNVNTGVVTGHIRTLGAMAKQLDPKTKQFVSDTGVISDALLNDLKTQVGYSSFTSKVLGKGINKITAPFFGTVEKFNRAVAATAGRDYALRLAQKGDVKTLQKLGVTGKIGKELTEAQQVQAARKIVEKTQFKVDPQDLPGWTDSPGGKLVAQFRTFSYNQSKFISNEVLKKAAKGDLMPLGRLMAALPVGYGLYETKRIIAGRPEEEDKTKVGLSTFQNIGGAGLVFDLYQSLNPLGSKYIPSDRRTSMAIGAFGGPAVGVASQGIGAVSELIQRKNTPKDESNLEGKLVVGKTDDDYTDATPIARFGLQQVPVVGTAIKNRLLPFKQESNAEAGKTTGTLTKDQIPITDKTEKDTKGNYTSRDKYDAVLHAFEGGKNDKNINIYDNAQLKKAIDDTKDDMNNELKTLGLPEVSADSRIARDYASYKKSDSDEALNTFIRKVYKDKPPKETAQAEISKWLPNSQLPAVTDEVVEEWVTHKINLKDDKLSTIDLDKSKKAILLSTFNSQLENVEKDLYSLSEEDLLDAYDNNKISDANIDNALAVERQLFDAGLIEKESLARKLDLDAGGYKTGKKGKGGKGKKGTLFQFPDIGLLNSTKGVKLTVNAPSVKKATVKRGRFAKKA